MLTLMCEACGGVDLAPTGSARTATHAALVLTCRTCRAEIVVEAGTVVCEDGEVHGADALPERLIPVGGDPDDPWVWHRARMLRSQRDVIQSAMAAARRQAGIPDGPLTVGVVLEWISADYLAGAQ